MPRHRARNAAAAHMQGAVQLSAANASLDRLMAIPRRLHLAQLVQLDNPGKGQLRSMRVLAFNVSQVMEMMTAIPRLHALSAHQVSSSPNLEMASVSRARAVDTKATL